MSYVKIADPKIIDLPTVHQIINTVNSHTETLSAITNNFGNIYGGAIKIGATTQYQFDLSSQQIVYGNTAINKDADTYAYTGYSHTVIVTLSPSFKTNPMIVAQASVLSGTMTGYVDVIVDVTNIGPSTFKIHLRHAGLTGTAQQNWLSGTVNVNWIAIGNK